MNHMVSLFALVIFCITLNNVIAAVSEEINIVISFIGKDQVLNNQFQEKPIGAHTCSAYRMPEDDLFYFDTSKAGK